MAEYAKDVLVSTQWLNDHLDDDSIRIVEVDESPDLYEESHIPGAVGFNWKADLQLFERRDFLPADDFGKLFGDNGIGNDHQIVLYGDRNNWFAAYAYWYLKYYGHDNVKLLNGPRELWIAEGRPITTEKPNHAPATFIAKSGDESIRALRGEIFKALDEGTPLVDVRSPQEYRGELLHMPGYANEGATVPGHIPGAVSIPWGKAVNEDGTFRSADELKQIYGDKGIYREDGVETIAYCRIGERSAHTWFVLHELLGQENVRNYDGSWIEWGNLVGAPIATGE